MVVKKSTFTKLQEAAMDAATDNVLSCQVLKSQAEEKISEGKRMLAEASTDLAKAKNLKNQVVRAISAETDAKAKAASK